jgi:hypothetical protein
MRIPWADEILRAFPLPSLRCLRCWTRTPEMLAHIQLSRLAVLSHNNSTTFYVGVSTRGGLPEGGLDAAVAVRGVAPVPVLGAETLPMV